MPEKPQPRRVTTSIENPNQPERSTSQTDLPKLAEITVVIPCFNEAESIQQLSEKLEELQQAVAVKGPQRGWHFLFVDDGSYDSTLKHLQAAFESWPNARVLRHEQNRGLIAALQTGFQACTTQWVAVIDSDCTYDPLLLIQLLNKADQEMLDVVTASPYHPQGSVGNVPAWRIAISRIASLLYRFPMRNKLTCYTCCVRVYRTCLVQKCQIHSSGFVGVTELLWRLDQAGAKIGEVPATLKPRITGVSKMRTAKTMMNHFRLLGSIAKELWSGKAP
jgi:dolichol-phosphate mannosyltransferase